MNAPLELGTLDGSIVTCAMHCAQVDVTNAAIRKLADWSPATPA
jgi:hypothetical protein